MSADARRFREGPFDSSACPGRVRKIIVAGLSLLAGASMLAILAPAAGALPAGRGYEKTSPNEKDGQDVLNGVSQAAASGDAIAWSSFGSSDDAEGAGLVTQFLSERTATNWLTGPIEPPQVPVPSLATPIAQDFTANLDTEIAGYLNGDPGFDGATPGTSNIYRINPDGSFDLLSRGQPPIPPGGFAPSVNSAGSSDDLSITAFTMNTDPALNTTSGPTGVPAVDNAYSSDGDNLLLVSVLPNGDPSPSGGVVGAASFGPGFNAVSNDGSTIFWQSGFGATPPEVYARIDGTDTVHISASQRNTPDPAGPQPKTWRYATPDGRFAYFSSAEKLTNNSNAQPGIEDLYRYDLQTDALVDLTAGDPDGGGLQGVVGLSDNGQRVYFGATGVLAPGATDGANNLYVRDGSTTTFIATIDQFEFDNYSTNGAAKTGRVTPSGSVMLFMSRADLGFNNAGFNEVYRYDLASGELDCISCRPNGAPATADTSLTAQPGALSLQALTLYERRNLSPDGATAFFTSPERLVPSDTNGKYDPYMWKDGALELVSSGTSANDSAFVDASASGDDAFFLTREQLVGIDTDDSIDLYDARVGGGLASQNPPPPPPPCQGDGCKPPATPQSGPPASGTTQTNNPSVPPPPDCASLDNKAAKKQAKVDKLQKKVGKASGKHKRKLKKKLKQAKKQAKKAQRQADQCNQG